MALISSVVACDCSEKGEGEGIELALVLTSTKKTNVSKMAKEVEIKVQVTVEKGELNPEKWEIVTKDLKGKKLDGTDSQPVLTCDQGNQILSKVATNFSGKLKKANGKKEFEVKLKTDQKDFRATTTTKEFDVKSGKETLSLKRKALDSKGKEVDKTSGTTIEFETDLNP